MFTWFRVHRTLIRVLLALAGLACGLAGWPVVTAVLLALLVIAWRSYEAVLIALAVDLTWQPLGAWPLFTIATLAALIALEPLRREFFE